MINNVNKYPISQLLDPESNLVFEIPKYQREYTWSSSQWENLFDDITDNDHGYFLGSIICINTTNDTINELKLEVVDGQQRLTTLSILLATLYSTLNLYVNDLDDDQRSDLLQLKRKLILKKTKDKIRVIPQTQNHNLDDYKGLLSDLKIISNYPKPPFAGNRRIFKAFNYFQKRINKYIEDSADKMSTLFEILEKINSAVIVMIEVSNHADAYTLFESLNNRGTPLTAVDLIKNLLLSRLDVTDSGNIDYYFEKWTQILNYIGDDYSVQERFFRHNYNAFRNALNEPFKRDDRSYPLGAIATRSNLLNIYEKIIKNDPQEFLETILNNASIYSTILLRNQDQMSESLKNSYLDLERIQGTPSYLLLLYLLKQSDDLLLTEDHIIKINKLLINFFVRRNLTDIPATRDLTRIFMSLVEEIEDKHLTGEDVYIKIRQRLIESSASDSTFKERLSGQVYIDNSGATRFILCMIAKQGMTLENQIDLWKYNRSKQYVWTIEHIFPQGENIPDSWVDMIANGDKDLAKEYQSKYAHTFGNLTITGYNSTLSNRSFEEKKERKDNNGNYVGYRNGLNLNADVVTEEKWTVDIITKRTQRMVDKIMTMFSL
ncbi:DUF262 domain-containing protein [Bacillus litorisediminis]|uniref:DUF262 domain-containing protein n=1 Tax=Bacillus litorisediminis TaxID=2922713 RepID=UPI001FAC10F1|nr:DUF262 domain-containing protein [Bacillus litorisediminis]